MQNPTKQEIFDRAVSGVIRQGRKAYTNKCVYRTLDTQNNGYLKCGVGHLLEDKEYKEPYDHMGGLGGTISTLIRAFPKGTLCALPDWMYDTDIQFLRDIQQIHDESYGIESEQFIKEFKRRSVNLAKQHDLDPKVAL